MILVLAGTSDGRDVVKALAAGGYEVLACAATPYGASLLEGSGAVKISGRRLSGDEMGQLIDENSIKVLVDATHPYAQEASNVATDVCRAKKVQYIRYQRPASQIQEHPLIVHADGYQEAAEKAMELGNVIFLATGSKTLEVFLTAARKKGRRVVARVLPSPGVMNRCFELGLGPGDVVALQGPYSRELNMALLRHYNASVLVTKDSGAPGGTLEKLSAALELGIPVVVVGRPVPPPEAVESISKLLERIREV